MTKLLRAKASVQDIARIVGAEAAESFFFLFQRDGWTALRPLRNHDPSVHVLLAKDGRKTIAMRFRVSADDRVRTRGGNQMVKWMDLHDATMVGFEAYLAVYYVNGEPTHRWRFYKVLRGTVPDNTIVRAGGLTAGAVF